MKKFLSLLLTCILALSTLPSILVHAEDNSKMGSLTIHKYEQKKGMKAGVTGDGTSNQEVPTDAKPLKGVTFEIKQIEVFENISNNGVLAKENVKPATNTKAIQVTTDEQGMAVFNNLPLGRYEVKEIAGPDHVNLNKTTYTVDIPMTSNDGKSLNYNVHIYPKNETKHGAVELSKKGVEGTLLKGAEFSLFKKDGTELKKELVTGEDGKIRIQGLEYGEYYFKETKAPKGYMLSNKEYAFTITESGTISEDGSVTSGKLETIVAENFQEPTIEKRINGDAKALTINPKTGFNYDIKSLIPEDIKDYKKYVITDTLDERLSIIGTPIVKVDGQTVDSSVVEVVIEGQKVSALVKDFAKLQGKKELHLQIKAQIKEGVAADSKIPNTATIDFINKEDVSKEDKPSEEVIVTPTLGNITLTKIDGKDKMPLQGAEFKLVDKKGIDVKVEGKTVTGVSNENGVISWGNIPYGAYQIIETKAPSYKKDDGTVGSYQKLRDPISVTIDKENKSIKLTVENNKNGWIIPATGGVGTTLFTVVGIILMLLAAVFFFKRKTKSN